MIMITCPIYKTKKGFRLEIYILANKKVVYNKNLNNLRLIASKIASYKVPGLNGAIECWIRL